MFVQHAFLAAISERNVAAAEETARAIAEQQGEPLDLASSLTLLRLYAEEKPAKYEAAAVRWLGRLLLEKRLSLVDVQTAAAALLDLRARPERFAMLMGMLARR